MTTLMLIHDNFNAALPGFLEKFKASSEDEKKVLWDQVK